MTVDPASFLAAWSGVDLRSLATWSGAVLLRPWWLAALPLLALVVLLARPSGGIGDWRRAIDAPLLAFLESRGAVLPPEAAGRRLQPLALAGLITTAALAGPALERPAENAFRNLDGLVVALDTSRSMAASGALAAAGPAVLELVTAAADRQSALVLYAGDAYAASPFTADLATLRPLLVAPRADLVPEAGSDPARALALARNLFGSAEMVGGDVVLVTDGGGLDEAAIEAAVRLHAEGKRVHVLHAAGTPDPAAPLPDPAAFGRLSAAGGGGVATVEDLSPIAAALAANRADRLGAAGYTALIFADYGRFLLLAAAVPLLLAFRRTA